MCLIYEGKRLDEISLVLLAISISSPTMNMKSNDVEILIVMLTIMCQHLLYPVLLSNLISQICSLASKSSVYRNTITNVFPPSMDDRF